ncbi:cytochrome C assembly family protein [Inmirania thermothiophila]|uniref:ABC-type uncharacterized transport system permease subunit n=1 Tax=Inmirania thermothiophila TaxID=1750597 RepID=A0A3N1Y8G4_9GAMM|nr:cytochrome c biogenesis protein CcsA [Inmirania thermothiophila]ROR35104.1 ABC-type uncharacterized transport system permease subunit [Inmirania thermothiophila]
MILTAAAAIALYLVAGTLLAARLLRAGPPAESPRPLILGLALLALLLHGAALLERLPTGTGLDLGIFNAASLFAWGAAGVLVAAALFRPVENLGAVILPLAALALLLDLLFPAHRPLDTSRHWALDLHILASVAAYAVLTLAAVQSALLALQDHLLRAHRPTGVVRALPPLQVMEGVLFQFIGVGFALLTLALLTGFFFVEDLFAQHLVHKTVLSLLSWLVFGALLAGRLRFGWRGRTAIRWTLGGFASLALAYFGSKLVLELVLHRTA